MGTDPSVADASHLPYRLITRTSDVTGNCDDVMVSCHPHTGLHCGIDAADHCNIVEDMSRNT